MVYDASTCVFPYSLVFIKILQGIVKVIGLQRVQLVNEMFSSEQNVKRTVTKSQSMYRGCH
jgi:hypothetical protein